MDYSNTKYGKLQILERIKIKNDNHITINIIFLSYFWHKKTGRALVDSTY